MGLITGGSIACCARDWLFIAATPAFYASLSAVIANQATIMDIRRCRDYILTYKLGYEKELNIVENIETEINESNTLQYRTHFNLGDFVTVDSFNNSTTAQITEATENFARNSYKLKLKYNRDLPTITSQMQGQNFVNQQNATQTEGIISGFVSGRVS